MDTFDEHNLGDLDKEIKELLGLVDSGDILENLDKLKNTLLKLEIRINHCGHCNGDTYGNGVCINHFT